MVRSDGADRRFHLFCEECGAAIHGSLGSRFDPVQTTFLALGAYKKSAPWAGARGAAKQNSGQNCLVFYAGPETRTNVYFMAA